MTNVLLAGVPQSTNLGDGLIALTLNHLIRMHGRHQVVHFDLVRGSGVRAAETPGAVAGCRLNEAGWIKRLTPDALRFWKAYRIDRSKDEKLRREAAALVEQADTVLIGGGHLLIDTYWTFPLAIRRVAEEAKRQGKPLHFVACGARGPWSLMAKRWFREALGYASTIAVRDTDSLAFLLRCDAGLAGKVTALTDPALYASEMFEEAGTGLLASGGTNAPISFAASKHTSVGRRRTIGLGIMDPHEMRRHSAFAWDRQACAGWWTEIADGLLARGYALQVFTNGAETDNAFVDRFVKPHFAASDDVRFLPYPRRAEDLIFSIRACDGLIAQRLHACIPGVSFRKPTYGVIWDKKLSSIYQDLGLGKYLIDFRRPPAELLASLSFESPLPGDALEKLETKKHDLFEHIGRLLP